MGCPARWPLRHDPSPFRPRSPALALVEEVQAGTATQQAEYAQQPPPPPARPWPCSKQASRHRTLARLNHPRGSEGSQALHLSGDLPNDAERLGQMSEAFYRSLQENPALAVTIRTLDPDALARLRARAADFAAIAKLALADVPQLRESLGLRER